jgi:hypothetical protein
MLGSPWAISSKRPHIFKPNVCFKPLGQFCLAVSGTLTLTHIDIALQVLDNVIMTRWKVLPREQCQGKINNPLLLRALCSHYYYIYQAFVTSS